MTDHNRYASYRAHEFSGKRRWKAAVSAIAMIIASAMVMTVGTSAYADDNYAVTQVEKTIQQQIETQNLEAVPADTTNGTEVVKSGDPDTQSNTGVDFNNLNGWSKMTQANIIGKTVALLNENGDAAVTSDMKDGALAVVDLKNLTEDSSAWQWKIVAADDKKIADDATEFSVYMQEMTGGMYLAADEDGKFSLVSDEEDATKIALKFTTQAAYDKAKKADEDTKLLAETFMLQIDGKDGRDFVVSDDSADSGDGSAASAQVYTAQGEDNPKKTDASPMIVWAMDDDNTAETNANADTTDGTNDANAAAGNDAASVPAVQAVVTDTVSPANATINLFDYWDTQFDSNDENYGRYDNRPGWGYLPSQGDPNYQNSVDTIRGYDGPKNYLNSKINEDHALKFVFDSGTAAGAGNQWRGSSDPYQGLVEKQLDDNGYPWLSGTGLDSTSTESLRYLFDPTYKSENENKWGRQSYSDVKGLLSYDAETSMYSYNAANNFAQFDEDTNSFIVTEGGVSCTSKFDRNGQFFPFNTREKISSYSGENGCMAGDINHLFGMTLSTTFTQNFGGHTNSDRTTDTVFNFAGDDDVWIFIDDVLVADLGGIHSPTTVDINFATGNIVINQNNPYATEGGQTITSTLLQQYQNANAVNSTSWSDSTFADGTSHTLKFFYLERGADVSNLALSYNLHNIPLYSVEKVDQYGEPVKGAKLAAYRGHQNSDGTSVYIDDNGNEVTDSINNSSDGVIRVNGHNITPLVVGTTDENGIMYFYKPGTQDPYTVSELYKANGNSLSFLMREIVVPEGYRTVSDDFQLEFKGLMGEGATEDDFSKLVLVSSNPYVSGVWASLSASVVAQKTLYTASEPTADGKTEIPYYEVNGNTLTSNGTLFAVVQHRHITEAWDALEDMDSWFAIYGSDSDGYQEAEGGEKVYSIEAAKKQASYGNNIFSPNDSNTYMEANLVNFPGDPTQYYSFVEQTYFGGNSQAIKDIFDSSACQAYSGDETQRFQTCAAGMASEGALKALDNVRYVVTYYWSDNGANAGTMDGVEAGNTVRVKSHEYSSSSSSSSSFAITWGSEVRIPNMENRLYYQNFIYEQMTSNTDGQDANLPWEGAKFALYEVGEGTNVSDDANSVIYYIPQDKSVLPENAKGVYLNPDPKRDGVLTDIAYFVTETGEPLDGSPTGKYEIKESGNIKVEIGDATFTIEPARNADYSEDHPLGELCVGESTGADDSKNYFHKLKTGTYVMRMITPSKNVPVTIDDDGIKYTKGSATEVTYGMNITEVPVVVTEGAVYANAGSNYDHVTVGNGAGYLVQTMNQFASPGIMNETLAWIAMFLRVNTDAKNFASFASFLESAQQDWGENAYFGAESKYDTNGNTEGDNYVAPTESGYAISRSSITTLVNAMTTYLEYDPDSDDSFFDYKPTQDVDGVTLGGQDARGDYGNDGVANLDTLGTGEGNRRLYTDQGWSMVNIYQDNTFGSAVTQTADHMNAAYESLLHQNITALFSNSTYVAFYSMVTELPHIEKVEEEQSYVATNFVSTDDGNCGGINNAHTDESGEVVACRTQYSTKLAHAQFAIRNADGLYITESGEFTALDIKDAKVYTTDVTGVLREALRWAAGAIYDADGNSPKYTIVEVSPPVGYDVINHEITFWLTNKGQNAAATYINVEPGTPGATVSDSGMVLYIENRPSLTIEKVATGTDSYIYVDTKITGVTDETKPSLADVQAGLCTTCTVSNKEAYDAQGEDGTIAEYFTGYTKPVNGATFILQNEDGQYYSEVIDETTGAVTASWGSEAKYFTSKEFGVVVTPVLSEGTYTLTETKSPETYTLVNPFVDSKITFSIVRSDSGTLVYSLGEDSTGLKVSEDGQTLYVENKPVPTIVKVETGTEETKTVLLSDEYAGSGITCAQIAADKANEYRTYGTPSPTQDQIAAAGATVDNGKLLENCFVGYSNNLQGAKFQLEKTSNGATTHYSGTAEDGTPIWGDSAEDAEDLVSASSGLVIALKDGKAGDQYKLTEIAAPNGYALVATSPIEFSLNAEGLIGIAGQKGLKRSLDGTTLYVENKAGYELPSTGGLVWYWLLLIAALAIAIGLGIYGRTRSRINGMADTAGLAS